MTQWRIWYCSIIKSLKSVLNKLEIENITRTKITSKKELKKLVNPIALREAVVNAFVHNDYTYEVPPVIEIFSNRIQITSYGGLVNRLSKEDFFECRSMPRNTELMHVFKDLDMVEQLGSGMERILNIYEKSIFDIKKNFLIVNFKFNDQLVHNDIVNGIVIGKEASILNLLESNKNIAIREISNRLQISESTVSRSIKKLKELKLVSREESDKTGRWIVKK